jgi:hypothetical protein
VSTAAFIETENKGAILLPTSLDVKYILNLIIILTLLGDIYVKRGTR